MDVVIVWLLTGGIVGWIASGGRKNTGGPARGQIVFGMLGGFFGAWILNGLGVALVAGTPGHIVLGAIGAGLTLGMLAVVYN